MSPVSCIGRQVLYHYCPPGSPQEQASGIFQNSLAPMVTLYLYNILTGLTSYRPFGIEEDTEVQRG